MKVYLLECELPAITGRSNALTTVGIYSSVESADKAAAQVYRYVDPSVRRHWVLHPYNLDDEIALERENR